MRQDPPSRRCGTPPLPVDGRRSLSPEPATRARRGLSSFPPRPGGFWAGESRGLVTASFPVESTSATRRAERCLRACAWGSRSHPSRKGMRPRGLRSMSTSGGRSIRGGSCIFPSCDGFARREYFDFALHHLLMEQIRVVTDMVTPMRNTGNIRGSKRTIPGDLFRRAHPQGWSLRLYLVALHPSRRRTPYGRNQDC